MKFPKDFFSQSTYKDHNGNNISSEKIDAITTYKYLSDGFYIWMCSECGNQKMSRSCGWPIMGQALKCPECKTMNLLLWNGTDVLMDGKIIERKNYDYSRK